MVRIQFERSSLAIVRQFRRVTLVIEVATTTKLGRRVGGIPEHLVEGPDDTVKMTLRGLFASVSSDTVDITVRKKAGLAKSWCVCSNGKCHCSTVRGDIGCI
eukprot:SAG31_NODE_9426_length_1278_cov_1.994063_2_plen_102_part_00